MTLAEIRKLTPLERFLYWIRIRESIRQKREAGEPKPWTDDEILQSYRFCNVHRINDRVSQWLLHHWYVPYRDHPNMLVAATLARQLNNTDALRDVGFPKKWSPKVVEHILDVRAARGLKNYSAAYMITSNYGTRGREPQTKQYQTVWIVCNPVYESRVKADTSSMQRTHEGLLPFKGFSTFIAGQVVADLRHGLTGTWDDKWTWAPLGPGSRRGLNRLHSRRIDANISDQGFLREMMQLYQQLVWQQGTLPTMEAMDFQSCLCEFDKYERVLWGEGRPKQLYNGRG